MLRYFAIVSIAALVCAQSPTSAPPSSAGLRLVRSLSGPSGKLIGTLYVLDENRNRFVSPQDRALVIYFEWQAPAGDHTITGIWKDPSGKVAHISPDIRMQTPTDELKAYWAFEIYPGFASGIWTLETRVDGQPGGTHNFELVMPAQASTISLNDIYRTAIRSIVWVRKVDGSGHRVDTSSGFVIGADRVVTAFQAIDAADAVEVEFPDGRTVKVEQLWSASRLEDWAVLKVETKDTPPLTVDRDTQAEVGDRPIVLNVEAGMTRTLGGVDVSGHRQEPGFGERIQISPAMAAETAGGPLIAMSGKVVGLLGGSLIPGSRYERRSNEFSRSPNWAVTSLPGSAIPIRMVRESNTPMTFAELRSTGTLTPPIHPHPNFSGATLAAGRGKDGSGASYGQSQFSRRDPLTVQMQWIKKGKEGKGTISASLYDAIGRVVAKIQPKKVSLNADLMTALDFSIPLTSLPKGSYRVDLAWNDDIVARLFATITD